MGRLKITDVSEENWRAVANLAVAPGQEGLIESNTQSLLEAAYDSSLGWRPLALWQEDHLVGFAMIGAEDSERQTIWLDRLMLGADFQCQGLGRHFLRKLLQWIKTEYHVQGVFLSLHRENQRAARLYQSEGFVDLAQVDPENGEAIFYREYV